MKQNRLIWTFAVGAGCALIISFASYLVLKNPEPTDEPSSGGQPTSEIQPQLSRSDQLSKQQVAKQTPPAREPADIYRFSEPGLEVEGTSIIVTQPYVRAQLENLGLLLQQLRVVPYTENGQMVGFKLDRIKAGSIFDRVGFRDGDIVTELDGAPLNDIAEGISKLQVLRTSEGFAFKMLRGDLEQTYRVDIRP